MSMILYCNNCDGRTGQVEVWTTHLNSYGWMRKVYKCQQCGETIYVVINTSGLVKERYPFEEKDINLKGVPEDILEDFKEAVKDNGATSYKSCVMMCRRAIQNAAEDKGAKPGARPVDQLKELKEKGVLYPNLFTMAEKIRVMGGKAAHPQDGKNPEKYTVDDETDLAVLDEVKPEEAEKMIDFTAQVLNFLYSLDYKINSLEEKPEEDGKPSN